MSDRLVTVATVDSPAEAGLIRSRLEGAGIPAFVADDATAAMAWPLTGAFAGVKVQVAEEHARQAVALLNQPPARGPAGEAGPLIRRGRHTTARALAAPRRRDAAEEEPPPSPREEDAERALRAAAFGLLLPPLELYATWLLVKVLLSREPLDRRARRRALAAAALNLTLIAGLVLLVVSLFWAALHPARNQIDLLRLRHPERMVGLWAMTFSANGHQGVEELELRPDGRLAYRASGPNPRQASGSWGYEDSWFLFRLERFTEGDWEGRGQVITWRLKQLTAEQMTFETGQGDAVFVRPGAGP
jgi:hypothetical protein